MTYKPPKSRIMPVLIPFNDEMPRPVEIRGAWKDVRCDDHKPDGARCRKEAKWTCTYSGDEVVRVCPIHFKQRTRQDVKPLHAVSTWGKQWP